LICNLLEQVQKARCIGENHHVTKEARRNEPNFLDLSQFYILMLDLFDPYYHLYHIEGDCIDRVNQQYDEYPDCEALGLLGRPLESSETSVRILDLQKAPDTDCLKEDQGELGD
jgi:hypothetical protein